MPQGGVNQCADVFRLDVETAPQQSSGLGPQHERLPGAQTGPPATIAIVPAGYADGVDLRMAGRGVVLIRGRRAPIVGSVCMDMLIADVTGMGVTPGDQVVIIGSQKGLLGEDRIDVREVAATIGTIPWEVLCRIGSRITRLYV